MPEQLAKYEIEVIKHCERVGMCIKEVTMMLLVMEEKTLKTRIKIMKKLPFIEDKYDLVDLILDTK